MYFCTTLGTSARLTKKNYNMRKFFIVPLSVVVITICMASCTDIKSKVAGKLLEATETQASESEGVNKGTIDLKATEIMDLFIDWKPNTWNDLTQRLGLTVYGRGIMRQEDLDMDFFGKNIDYDATTDKFKKTADDAIGIAMLSQEVDGDSWELMLASKADYDALMAGMAAEKDYKVDSSMQQVFDESPDMHADKVFMKAVYDEEQSKMAGKRLGIGYYIIFEGERDGLYVVSFSHGNGDVEM